MAILSQKPSSAEKKPSGIPVLIIPPLLTPAVLCMTPIKWALQRRGFRTISYSYPSYRMDIPDNGTRLARFLEDLDEPELDVVAFSMGNIVLRWAANHHKIPKLRRVVMIGPPNQGAFMADWLDQKIGILFPLFFGKCARQLRRGDKGLAARAGNLSPETRIGIIAGGTRNEKGYNVIIPGDNDRTVAVSETILPGISDFVLVPQYHATLTIKKRSINLACDFIETGQFRRRGLPKDEVPTPQPVASTASTLSNDEESEIELNEPEKQDA